MYIYMNMNMNHHLPKVTYTKLMENGQNCQKNSCLTIVQHSCCKCYGVMLIIDEHCNTIGGRNVYITVNVTIPQTYGWSQ